MIEVENTDVNIVRNLIPMRNHMPASAYGLKAISDWLLNKKVKEMIQCLFSAVRVDRRKDDSLNSSSSLQ